MSVQQVSKSYCVMWLCLQVLAQQCRARTATMKLPHYTAETPMFMPVGTQGDRADVLTRLQGKCLQTPYRTQLPSGEPVADTAPCHAVLFTLRQLGSIPDSPHVQAISPCATPTDLQLLLCAGATKCRRCCSSASPL
jgi:hypothetical protein